MEGELWKGLYPEVIELGKRFTRPRVRHSNATILLVYLWAALHDRPVSWACRQENWPVWERRWPKPSPATMSRRLRSVSLLTMIVALEWGLARPLPRGELKSLDAKPLTVGGFSKDRDARTGWPWATRRGATRSLASATSPARACWRPGRSGR